VQHTKRGISFRLPVLRQGTEAGPTGPRAFIGARGTILSFLDEVIAVALHIRDEATSQLVRSLAKQRGIGLTEAIKLAVENELKRNGEDPPMVHRIAAIRRAILALRPTGEKADKAFFDSLGGES
jgi:antitoxin VapB